MKISWTLVVLLGWTATLAVSAVDTLTPASAFMVVGKVRVADTVVNQVPNMLVERQIKRDFRAKWLAEVEHFDEATGGWDSYCSSKGENNYSVDNVLPADLDLDWWTFPTKCTPAVPGDFRVTTTWVIKLSDRSEKIVWATSNTFKVAPN